jgi:dihydropteroate synthase
MKPDLSKINTMGVINTTPDSFSDGGYFAAIPKALEHARKLIDEGADILDIGGESTRPGAAAVPLDEEIRRTIPLIEAIRQFSDIAISIDTSKAEVMRAAAAAGADIINDVWALRRTGALQAAVETDLLVCLMHMQGTPDSMQHNPQYDNVVVEVSEFLQQRIDAAVAGGIERSRLIIDPGFGFGKTLEQNLQLLDDLNEFTLYGLPLLVGISRKSMLGQITGKDVGHRLHASLSAAVIAAMSGANIIRVHDVTETKDALAIVQAIHNFQNN